MARLFQGPRQTPPLIWCAAALCSLLAVAVIISGLVLVIGYLVIKPKVPRIVVTFAQLDDVFFDQSNLLAVQITAVVRAENRNAGAGATFYATNFGLSFRGKRIATLLAAPFDVAANGSVEFAYVAQSDPIPLSPEDAQAVSKDLGPPARTLGFGLQGRTRTRWKMWPIGSAKFWLYLDCRLELPVNGTKVYPRCTSSYK